MYEATQLIELLGEAKTALEEAQTSRELMSDVEAALSWAEESPTSVLDKIRSLFAVKNGEAAGEEEVEDVAALKEDLKKATRDLEGVLAEFDRMKTDLAYRIKQNSEMSTQIASLRGIVGGVLAGKGAEKAFIANARAAYDDNSPGVVPGAE